MNCVAQSAATCGAPLTDLLRSREKVADSDNWHARVVLRQNRRCPHVASMSLGWNCPRWRTSVERGHVLRETYPRLGGLPPDMKVDLNALRMVQCSSSDKPKGWSLLKGQHHRCCAAGTKM